MFCILGLFTVVLSLFDQAPYKGEEEKRNTDDSCRKPDGSTEGSELFQRKVITVRPYQSHRIVVYSQAHTENDDQEQTDKDGDSA